MSTSISSGHAGVGLIGSLGGFGRLAQMCDMTNPTGYCYPGGGTATSGGDGFNWGGLIAAISVAGADAIKIVQAANQYPYPYGNPYQTYPGGINSQMAQYAAQGNFNALAQYQGGFSLGGSTGILLILGFGMVMMMSMRR